MLCQSFCSNLSPLLSLSACLKLHSDGMKIRRDEDGNRIGPSRARLNSAQRNPEQQAKTHELAARLGVFRNSILAQLFV